jgi:uncharacterized heparinase superfamily protein
MTGPRTFNFLNVLTRLEWPAGWSTSDWGKPWLYNLHSFDDLNATDAASRVDWHRPLLSRWIDDNPPARGTGWEPYPTSLRMVNWIKWALGGNGLEPEWVASLAVQTRWLANPTKQDLLNYHLIIKAKALVFAGVFFEGEEAQSWLEQGLAIVRDQLVEQVLADGAHFELSPMYHSIILEDVLDLLNLGGAYPGVVPPLVEQRWRDTAQQMRRWLSSMCHPDGQIAFFNDAAFGIAAHPTEIEAYAGRCGFAPVPTPVEPVRHNIDSGYVRLTQGDCVVLLDVAAVGPSHLPGHAHADTLSFEMSIERTRVVVNSGTSQYMGTTRQVERSTAAHSTVEVDGQNSSEVWGDFHVGRCARVFDLQVDSRPNEIVIACSHDGYCRLPGRPVHRRRWILGNRSLRIIDSIVGGEHQAIARFHVAPGVSPHVDVSTRSGTLTIADKREITWRCSVPMRVEPSAWHPEFGIKILTTALVAETIDGSIETEFFW